MSMLAFDQEQAQKLAEIGTHLRNIRSQKGLSLEEIAAKTMIQHRFLSAIEKGQIEQLPEAVYIRGFIRRFAEALGLDGKSLSETFPLGRDRLTSYNSRVMGTSAPTIQPWHLYLTYLVVVGVAVAALYALFNRSETPSGSSAIKPVPKVSVSPKKATAPAVKPKPLVAPVVAKLVLKADSYFEVSTDGKPTYDGILKAGTTRTFTAQKEINLFTGNAGGVTLEINNQPAKVMGEPGQPKEAILTPSSKQL
jgi:cytoskeletal protein RodZ